MPERPNHGAASYNNGTKLEILIGPDRAQEVSRLLLQGAEVKDLVPVIQNEWQLLTDKKPATVKTMLYRYNRQVVKRETLRRVAATVTTASHLAVTTLEDLSNLCKRQKLRVEKALTTEDLAKGMLTDMATKQITLYGSLLKDLAVLQIETGLLPRAPKTVKGMMMGPDGVPTAFGWVENDDALLDALKSTQAVTYDPTG